MKKKYIFTSIIAIFIVAGGFFCVEVGFNDLIRMPVKRNVILDYKTINITNINIDNNYVYIEGELNIIDNEYLDVYTIEKVDFKKKKNVLYFMITGGYGVGKENQKFVIDKQFDGEEIKKIVCKGRKMSSKVIWEAN